MDSIETRGWPIKTSTSLHLDDTHARFEIAQVWAKFYIRINTERYGSDATIFLSVDQLQDLQNAIEAALEKHEQENFVKSPENA